MFCFAVHNGARRPEIVRALPSDIDLAVWVVTIREKKRDKTKNTYHIPLTPFLTGVMTEWLEKRGPRKDTLLQGRWQPDQPAGGTQLLQLGVACFAVNRAEVLARVPP